MPKVLAITLAFCNAEILTRSLHYFYNFKNPDLKIDRHVIVDQHYPLSYESKIKPTLAHVREKYGAEILDPGRNLGLHIGVNWALSQIRPASDDIIIGYDPDSMPITAGWDMALVRALEGGRWLPGGEVVWATLGNPRTMADITARGYDPATVDGYLELWLTRTAITNSVCAWRYGWLEAVGYLEEPRAFYGHLEAAMFAKLRGKKWAVLPGFQESDELRHYHDKMYTAYKWAHSHTYEWDGDFESFLAAGCPGYAETPAALP